ncbi:heparinase [Anaerofilum sp. An201]|nr:heparinase II/III family protein [Anaerofilum sp. An201]OUP05120.1 heparinase [Anaerofilum sp. An201]
MFCDQLRYLPARLHPFVPCPPASDRAAWQALPDATRARLIENGEYFAGKPVPALPFSAWLAFGRTGDRVTFEYPYFLRRRMLCHLVMAECCEGKGRFTDDILNLIWAICEETAWQVPAHNSYIRDTPQLPLPDASRPIIDLFAAETGALLAMARYLLGDELEQAAPGLRSHIGRLLETRILVPYLGCHFWWMGLEGDAVNNWTPWCTQNVLVTALLSLDGDPVRTRAVIRKAACSLDAFVDSYGEDGCCDEGAQYYGAAAVCLFGALHALDGVAPEAFGALWSQPKLHNMARFIFNVHVDDKYYINFSDCSPLAGRRTAREFLFAKKFGDEAMMAFTAADFLKNPDPDFREDPYLSGGINLYYAVLGAFAEADIRACTLPDQPAGSLYYRSVGLLMARHGAYVLGAKAGCNDDSHNHNDTGSVTLYKNGQPFLIDIGVENYTKKTFSPQRYEIWTMQSQWHNLPTFGTVQQLPGREYCARAVHTELDADHSSISMDIAGAYPPVPGMSFYHRSVRLDAEGLVLEDETDYPSPVTMTLMFRNQPVLNGAVLEVADLGVVELNGVAAEVSAVPVTDSRLLVTWPDTLWKVQLTFTGTLHLVVR